MHRNSLPEQFPVQTSQHSGNDPQLLHVRRSSHEPFLPKGEVRTRTPASPTPAAKHPAIGVVGRSQSSTQLRTFPNVPENVTELMTLHKFSSKGADDISVRSEEVVYSDLSKQPERDWLWVYSPRLERHGYIPRNIVSIPGSAGDFRGESVARV